MKKYLNPEYKNEVVMSNDVITVSHVSSNVVTDPTTGEVLYVEKVYRNEETNEFSAEIGANVNTLLGI